MKKIALVGCYFQHNYGSQLQALALQEFLTKNNFPVEYIDVKLLSDFENGKKAYYKSKIFDLKFIKSKLGMVNLRIKKKLSHSKKIQQLKIRDKKFNEFKHNFCLSKKYHSYKELYRACLDKYTDVIVGSDQLWLPVNVASDYYTLNWTPDNVNKISYSTSFGFNAIPNKYKEKYGAFLSRINHLSVREDSGNKLIKDNFNLKAETVVDPTMLLTCDEWLNLSKGERRIGDKYIFVYFLGKNKEHWNFVKRLKEKTGYKIVSLNHCDEYFKYADKISDMPLYDVNPFDFINLINHAEYVCTDSFHGSVFSILNHKTFFTFRRFQDKNKVSTNSRVYSLLKKFGIENRLLLGTEKIDDVIDMNIDYSNVDSIMNAYRESSQKWLLDSIQYKENKPKKVGELNKWECCGCHSCMNICPVKAITMVKDCEGFLYPSIDESKCVNCGLCIKSCAFNSPQPYEDFEQYGYVVQNKDEKILKESTSGGAFTAFAKTIIEKGGVVYGVKLDENYEAHHVKATTVEELGHFRNSKYVQAEVGTTFREVRDLLKNNIPVLYSGTGCQIEGLYSFLKLSNTNTDLLKMVEVVCHDVVSPTVLAKYMEYQSKKRGNVDKVVFRDKTIYGYDWSNLSVYDGENRKYHNGLDMDPYLKLMFNGTSIRPSCSCCSFKHKERHSDITIWDCFDVANYDQSMNNNKGATKVLINSKNGEELFSLSTCSLIYKRFSADELVYNNYEMFNKPHESANRGNFFKDMNEMDSVSLFDKYAKPSFKDRVKNSVKVVLIRTHLYSKLKSKKLGGRGN